MDRPVVLGTLTLALLLLGVGQPVANAMASPQQPTSHISTIAVLPLNCAGYPLTLYDGYVYFGNFCIDMIQRVSETGGPVQNITSLPGGSAGSFVTIEGIAVSEAWVFWTQDVGYYNGTSGPESLMRAPLWGGEPQVILSLGSSALLGGVTVSGNYVYFNEGETVMAMTVYETDLHAIVSEPDSFIWQTAISQGNLYWYDPGYGAVYSVSLLGVGLKQLSVANPALGGGEVADGARDIMVANGTVYWTDDRNASSWVYSVPVNGGPTQTLYSGGNLTGAFTIADAGQYVAFDASGGSGFSDWGIFLIPKAGGPVTALVDNVAVEDMAVSGNYVYFSANNITADTIDVVALPSS